MENKGVILLIEDNAELNDSNSRALRLRGYDVLSALTLKDAREWLREREPDVILLDVMLPDGDGFDFCAEIRPKTSAHVLFLTAKTEHEDMVRGLKGGGDDYIVKPFHPEELLARIDAAVRRRKMDKTLQQIIKKGTLVLDIIATQAFIEGEDLNLQTKEFLLLLLLVQNEGNVITTEDLYSKIWGRPMAGDKTAVQKAASRLRKKLDAAGYTVRSVYSKGYVFEPV